MDILKQLKLMNAVRCPAAFNHTIDEMPLLFWSTAVGGEAGELLNWIKKFERGDYGFDTNSIPYLKFEENVCNETADIIIYLDMLMQKLGLDLRTALMQKFNQTSIEKNVPFLLIHPSNENEYTIDDMRNVIKLLLSDLYKIIGMIPANDALDTTINHYIEKYKSSKP